MSFYTSLTGLNSATAQLGVTSNNIANVGTTGFKRSRADFGDIFATSPLQKASSTIGQGVALKQVTQEFGQGNVAFSANALDLAITGDGFFPLKSADGLQDIYTRNGSFMMNDQYNVVNSAGQRLMAASVDSSGKADLGALSVLTIPQQTTGEAAETSLINLGLNFPADAQVITEPFNRNNSATYNKSTALTVYDSGGNGYLATVYYAKTQNASQLSPYNKWQTYVFVGDTQVNPSLIQATDDNAERLYVNKYGEIKPESEVSDFLVNGKTQMFSLDDLTDTRVSQPAAIVGETTSIDLTAESPYDFSALADNPSVLKNLFTIDVDNSGSPVTIDLSDLATADGPTLTGVAIAKELTNRLNSAFGDERYFDFQTSASTKFQLNASVAGEAKSIEIDLTKIAASKEETISFSDAGGTGNITVTADGVDVTIDIENLSADEIALAVKEAFELENSFDPNTSGREIMVDGSTLTITWAASDENISDAVVDVGTTGLTADVVVGKYFAKDFTSLDKVKKSTAVDAVQTLIDAQGLSTVTVRYDQVKGGFAFFEDGGGAISVQLPQSYLALNLELNEGIVTNDNIVLELESDGTAISISTGSLTSDDSLDDIVAALQSDTDYENSGYTISNVNGQLRVARNDGQAFDLTVDTSQLTNADLTDDVGVSVIAAPLSADANDDLNSVLGISRIPSTVSDDTGLYVPSGASLNGKVMPNGTLIRPLGEQRYGLKVTFDNVNERFTFSSGTTGDESSIRITNTSTMAESLLGISASDAPLAVAVSSVALRGTVSQPAQTVGTQVAINVNNNFSVDLSNNTFVVSVDDVKGTVTLPPSDTYTLDGFMAELEKQINSLASTSGSTVSGVKVSYDRQLNAFRFTTGTTGTNSFIKVSGSSNWGLSNVEAGRGSTSNWIKPTQFTDYSSGVGVAKYIDEFGNETSSADGFTTLPEWSPIYLDKGELTFNTSGNLISPQTGSQLDTVYLADGKGALTINIDYSASTQYSSAFAVLSQSQDGRPEGDLVGLNIGDDGLVSASYSNGSQLTLAKVILANFSSPAGLRQIGDSSFYATAKSGDPKIGEAGSAGFGTIRAGATERANVDLTQELVDLITAQRNFQANAKAIETSTTMTQAIIQIRT
jgi:flagellar hook-basal body protein